MYYFCMKENYMTDQLINETALKLAHAISKSKDAYSDGKSHTNRSDQLICEIIDDAGIYNPWFTPQNVMAGLQLFVEELLFLSKQDKSGIFNETPAKSIGFIYKSGRPFEGMAEIVYTALSGFNCNVQIVAEDQFLFRKFIEILSDFPLLESRIHESENLKKCDCYVSFNQLNRTSREYFNKYPLLELDHHGSSMIITGKEKERDFMGIADSLCLFFGRSGRNVKVLFVPKDFIIDTLQPFLDKYSEQLHHHRYYNNFEYRKSVMIINRIKYTENPPILITEHLGQAGYTSVITVKRYNKPEECAESELTHTFPLLNYPERLIQDYSLSSFKSDFEQLHHYLEELKR